VRRTEAARDRPPRKRVFYVSGWWLNTPRRRLLRPPEPRSPARTIVPRPDTPPPPPHPTPPRPPPPPTPTPPPRRGPPGIWLRYNAVFGHPCRPWSPISPHTSPPGAAADERRSPLNDPRSTFPRVPLGPPAAPTLPRWALTPSSGDPGHAVPYCRLPCGSVAAGRPPRRPPGPPGGSSSEMLGNRPNREPCGVLPSCRPPLRRHGEWRRPGFSDERNGRELAGRNPPGFPVRGSARWHPGPPIPQLAACETSIPRTMPATTKQNKHVPNPWAPPAAAGLFHRSGTKPFLPPVFGTSLQPPPYER